MMPNKSFLLYNGRGGTVAHKIEIYGFIPDKYDNALSINEKMYITESFRYTWA